MNDAFIRELWEGEEPGALCSIMRHVSPCTEHLALRVSRVARQIADLSGGPGLAVAELEAERLQTDSTAAVLDSIDALEETVFFVLQDCPAVDRAALSRAFAGLIREVVGDDPRAELEAAA